MPVAEIRDTDGNYVGYARFSVNGEFLGTYGGYGAGGNQSSGNGGSRVQNAINMASLRIANRQREVARRRVPLTGQIRASRSSTQRRERRSRRRQR